MNIKKFAEKTGLTPRAIRFYEEKGILKSQRDVSNKYRVYTQEQVMVAAKIGQFRKLGFSIEDIAAMLRASPSLSVESVQRNIKSNLKRLQRERAQLDKKLQQTEALLSATRDKESLNSGQKELFQTAAFVDLQEWSTAYLEQRLRSKSLGPDEQLQMVACAYADLVLRHRLGAKSLDYSQAHHLIAKTLDKIKEPHLATRHKQLAEAYENLHKDPNYYELPI